MRLLFGRYALVCSSRCQLPVACSLIPWAFRCCQARSGPDWPWLCSGLRWSPRSAQHPGWCQDRCIMRETPAVAGSFRSLRLSLCKGARTRPTVITYETNRHQCGWMHARVQLPPIQSGSFDLGCMHSYLVPAREGRAREKQETLRHLLRLRLHAHGGGISIESSIIE